MNNSHMEKTLLSPEFETAVTATSRDHVYQALSRFAEARGFERFGVIVVPASAPAGTFYRIDNCPAEYESVYQDPAEGQTCPVMQKAKRSILPFHWNQADYTREAKGQLWEEQAPFGYAEGFMYAPRMVDGSRVVVSVERPRQQADEVDISRNLADVTLFATMCADTCVNVATASICEPVPKLSDRELECLGWAMKGKTAWETGMILAIAERTVVAHLGNATRKLGAINKHAAVVKAVKLGLL